MKRNRIRWQQTSMEWLKTLIQKTRHRFSMMPSENRALTGLLRHCTIWRQAIELNDDRAVYRSQLLLDSDLAARSASLARIYSDLGFQDLALVEGWKSVNTDPADYSAHRFLSDSYSVLPRHEIARVSELLQSQLLQPININPVQPHLAESNLYHSERRWTFRPFIQRIQSALQPQQVFFASEWHCR